MPDERDEVTPFRRAGEILRAADPRDAAALARTLRALAAARAGGDAGDAGDVVPDEWRGAEPSARRRRVARRGDWRFVAGLAAGLAFAVGLGAGVFAGWRMRGAVEPAPVAVRGGDPLPAGDRVPIAGEPGRMPVQFTFVAPGASRVALVGEFNDWDPATTPMRRSGDGAWHVALELPRGRHVYAFVVDGTDWVADPQAPIAPESWFGARNSVVLVQEAMRQ